MSDHTFEKIFMGKSLFQIYSTSECPIPLHIFDSLLTAQHSCEQMYTAVLAATRFIYLFLSVVTWSSK